MERVDQCVASRGRVSRVRVSIRSTATSLIYRGAPGRGSSSSPARRCARKRLRHLPTVCIVAGSWRATAVLLKPSAQASTMRQRSAKACAELGLRLQRSRVSLSSQVSCKDGMGRPTGVGVLLSTGKTHDCRRILQLFLTQDTSGRVFVPTSFRGSVSSPESPSGTAKALLLNSE